VLEDRGGRGDGEELPLACLGINCLGYLLFVFPFCALSMVDDERGGGGVTALPLDRRAIKEHGLFVLHGLG